MNIENLRRLINGEALNKPSVSAVEGFSFDAKTVKKGFAFIGVDTNLEEIKAAVLNGAYAVVTEEEFQIIDPEVAFIKVDSLSTALMRLIRFESSYKNLKFYLINAVQKAILRNSHLGQNASLLPGEMTETFIKIMKANVGDTFFTNESKILSKIAPLFDAVGTDTNATCINSGSIFSTNVVCEEIYYQGLNFPNVFIGYLCGLLKFLSKNDIKFKLGDLRNLGHFEPIFVDRSFKVAPFGTSQRAFIAENDEELFEIEAAFLNKKFSDGIEICAPQNSGIKNATFAFKELAELKKLRNFHYALVKCKKADLEAMLNEAQTDQKSLFD